MSEHPSKLSRREFLRLSAITAAGAALAACVPTPPEQKAPTQVLPTEVPPTTLPEVPTGAPIETPVPTEAPPALNIFATSGEVFAAGGESAEPISIVRVPEYLVKQALGATEKLPPGTNTIEFFVNPAGEVLSISPSEGPQQVGTFPREFDSNGKAFVWDWEKGLYEAADGEQAEFDPTFENPNGYIFPCGVLAKVSGTDESGQRSEDWRMILLDTQDTDGDGNIDSIKSAWCGTESHNPEVRAVRPSLLDEVAYRETVEGVEINGFQVPEISIVTGKTFIERPHWFPADRVILDRANYPDAEQRLAALVMQTEWHAWISDDMENRKGVSFEEFMGRLVNGDDMTYKIMVIRPEVSVSEPQETPIDPKTTKIEFSFINGSKPIYTGNAGVEEISYGLILYNGVLHFQINWPGPIEDTVRGDLRDCQGDPAQIKEVIDLHTSQNPSVQLTAIEILAFSNAFQQRGFRAGTGETPSTSNFPDLAARVSRYWETGDESCWDGIIRVVPKEWFDMVGHFN
ncbi:MAG TPA: twin-arginine translocation signal domain-containing protein [Candidatus Bathyarchaeia archaeon]|nr:twin-arginine translocation signal domain-containing protein [Candidatus Bathyarchaeia archaeon]